MQQVSDTDFQSEVREAEQPVVVMFKAAWCNPCKDFFPLVEDLAGKMSEFKFVTADLEEAPQIADELGIRTIPSLALFADGMVRDIMVGRHPKTEVRLWITENH